MEDNKRQKAAKLKSFTLARKELYHYSTKRRSEISEVEDLNEDLLTFCKVPDKNDMAAVSFFSTPCVVSPNIDVINMQLFGKIIYSLDQPK